MSYLGSVPSTGTPFSNNKIQVLSGNGSNTQFTLDYRVNGKEDIEVIVNNVQQNPFDGSYEVSNNNILTFSGAPSSGSNNIHVYFRGYSHNVSVPAANSINSNQLTTTGVTAGTYGNTTVVPVVTVDAAGRITSATTNSIFVNAIALGNTLTTKAIVPDANVTYDIGTATMRYKDLYLANSTIYIGNTTVSETGGSLQISNAGAPAVNLATITQATDLAANAYSNAVSVAATDATNKAANAYSNATTYAASIAGTAYSNAVVTASADATSKAATAYSNAVSTASADATTKAATAYSNATTYAATIAGTAYSNAVSVAATDATNKAANAYSNAVAYAAANSYVNSTFAPLSGATFSGAVSGITTLAAGNTTITGTANVTANLTANNVRTYGSVQIDGDLTVSGNTVTVNATNLAVEDNMIYLNNGSTVSHPDLGIAGNYNDGTYKHAGFFRDATDARWKFFDGYTPEPDASAYIDTANASFRIADIQANVVYGVTFTGTANNASYLGGQLPAYYANATAPGTAYSNAVSYADTIAGTAYSNAVSYVTNQGFARTNGATFSGTVNFNAQWTNFGSANSRIGANQLQFLYQAGDNTIDAFTKILFRSASDFTNTMVVDIANKNVSIANTLVVSGGVGFSGSYTAQQSQALTLGSDTSNSYIQSWGSRALIINPQGNPVGFYPTSTSTPTLYLTTGGSVGIGMASPGHKLDVDGNIRTRDGGIVLSTGTTQQGGLYMYNRIAGSGTDYSTTVFSETGLGINFSVNGSSTKAAVLAANGNFGVGTTSPGYKFVVNGGLSLDGKSLIGSSGYFINGGNGFRWNDSTDVYNNVIMYDNGNMYVRGNTGLGTTSPGEKLDVAGNIKLRTGSAVYVENPGGGRLGAFGTNGTGTYVTSHNGFGEPLILSSPSGYMSFSVGGVERIRVAQTDGTTNFSNSVSVIDNKTSNTNFAVYNNSGSAGSGAHIRVGYDATYHLDIYRNSNAADYYYNGRQAGASHIFQVDGSNALIANTSGIYTPGNVTAYYSDDNLKTKLGKIENALEKVCALEGFYYEANETAQALGYQPVREVGLSAQSTQKSMPEIVVPAPIDNKYLTIKYERYAPYFVEAIKELNEKYQAHIDRLEARIKQLEGE